MYGVHVRRGGANTAGDRISLFGPPGAHQAITIIVLMTNLRWQRTSVVISVVGYLLVYTYQCVECVLVLFGVRSQSSHSVISHP